MTQLLERAIFEVAQLPEKEQDTVAGFIFRELKVVKSFDLESGYRQMAADKPREAEALEWAEALVGDADATR